MLLYFNIYDIMLVCLSTLSIKYLVLEKHQLFIAAKYLNYRMSKIAIEPKPSLIKKVFILIYANISFLFMILFIILGHNRFSYLGFEITPASAIAIVGILSYHTTLSLDNFAQQDATIKKGLMRNAVAATFIVVYVIYFSYIAGGDIKEVTTVTENLKDLTKIVIIFYFGSEVASELIKKLEIKAGG